MHGFTLYKVTLLKNCQTLFGARQEKMSCIINIDDLELVLHHRHKHTVKKLLEISAKEIAPIISCLVIENCSGCNNTHLSQTHHQCFTMEKDEQLYRYFDIALERASGTKVVEVFVQSLKNNYLNEMIHYNLENWKTVFCTEQRQLLKQEIFKLL